MTDLDSAYERSDLELSPEVRLAQAFGVRVPAIELLYKEIFEDLDEENGGLRWWTDVDFSRRVLISDHLLSAVDAAQGALLEAKLHLLEFRKAEEHAEEPYRRAIRRGVAPEEVQPHSPRDEVWRQYADLHTVAFFRAVGSLLDNVASVLIGVLGIPMDIVKADWKQLRKLLAAANSKVKKPVWATPSHAAAAIELEASVSAAGPVGWLQWVLGTRNTFVHRPRPMILAQEDAPDGGLTLPRSAYADAMRVHAMLPRYPGRTTIEALRDAPTHDEYVLSERAEDTMDGVLGSCQSLVNSSLTYLLEVWRARRTDSSLIPQPAEKQWPETTPQGDGFDGYRPGTFPLQLRPVRLNPVMVRRMKAAFVFDHQRPRWCSEST